MKPTRRVIERHNTSIQVTEVRRIFDDVIKREEW